MTFVRIKKIKGAEYAYLVQNNWTKKGARQRVSRYLGKLIKLMPASESEFLDKIKPGYVLESSPEKIIDDLIAFELVKYGFKKVKTVYVNGSIVYDPNRKTLLSGTHPVVLYLHDGYFTGPAVNRLYGFSYLGDERAVGEKLAEAFLDAGVHIPQDLFIPFFAKVYRKGKTTTLL